MPYICLDHISLQNTWTTIAYIFWDMFLWDKFIIGIELYLFSCGCNSWLLHVSCATLARASAFRLFLNDCLFVWLYGMCCEFSAISFLKQHHSISMTCSGFNFLLLVAWCFLFLDVLLLMLLPRTALVFVSFTLHLYICNNNYFLFNKCFPQSQREGNFEAFPLLVLQITLASQF